MTDSTRQNEKVTSPLFDITFHMYSMSLCFYAPLVVALLGGGGPSDISGLVVAIIVWKAVDRMFGRRPATYFQQDVSKEGDVALPPLRTDLDAAPPIVFEEFVPRVFAASNDTAPKLVLGRPGVLRTFAVLQVKGRESLCPIAATAFSRAIPENQSWYDFVVPAAVASNAVCAALATCRQHVRARIFDHGKAPKALAGKIDCLGHAVTVGA